MADRNDVRVREVARSDLDQWHRLWDGYNEFYGRSGPTALPEEITATTWERFFDTSEPVFCLVAEQGGRLVVTHDIDEAIALANRIVMLDDGCLAADIKVAGAKSRALRTTLLAKLGVA